MNEVKIADRQLAGPSSRSPFKASRTLKIDNLGDPFRGSRVSGIRLKGRWLTRAGFQSGERVAVTVVSPGHMELKSVAESEVARSAQEPKTAGQRLSPDLRVSPQGTVWLFYALTDRAREWMGAHCPAGDDHQYFCGALVVEARYVEDLLAHAVEDGLEV
ncbi:MAG TPA: SymE family type I addiction module toxin [Candidatus Binatia bacterium]|jgi:hypothetical protein|nr:SymE family type I addiction module toxin [Candidatus Binatia bacterium]